MRLWWISAAALVVVCCAIGQSEAVESSGHHVETKDSRNAQTSGEGKVLVKRRRKLDGGSNESENVSSNDNEKGPSEATASPEDTSLPKSTTFIQSRAAMFNRLNQPLLRNRALDTTISKLRSRLGALASSEEPSYPKKRLVKKLKKPTTTAASASEESPISIQVPRDHPQHEGNDSMIMIPVPESQRKPYQPVIMQVSKSNESSTASPDTKVVTYKLNKMFVPIGIYGKVVGNVEETNTTSSSASSSQSHEAKGLEIRHKGTQSESSEKFTGVKVSGGSEESQSHEEEKWISKDGKSKVKKVRKPKEHSRIADSIDITYDYKPNKYDQVSIASERPDVSKISLTTLSPLDSILSSGGNDENNNRRVWGGQKNGEGQGGLTRMSPPRPMNKESPGSSGSFLDTIKQTASNLPSFLHKGLTSLSSITSSFNENPFHDDTFTSASEMKPTQHRNGGGVVASVPGGYLPPSQQQLHNQQRLPPNQQSPSSIREHESLEFFRNRPHLFGRGRKFKHPKANSGFRPVTPSAHMAQEYYASAPTASAPRKNQRDSEAAGSGSYESVVKVNSDSSAWSGMQEPQMVPTEDFQSSWKDYLFSSGEFGNSPGSVRSWRNLFGLAPAIEQSSIVNPTFGGSTMDGARRRSLMMDRKWKTITSKYSKNEIDEAKMNIHKYFSGAESRSFEEKPSFGGAFEELLQMFQLWFNVGTGRSVAPLTSYEHIQSEARQSSEDSWKPISKSGGSKKPLISFSAGISFPTKNPGGRSVGSHYSASPKPYIPQKYGNSLTNHITTLAHNYVGPTDPSGYGEAESHDHSQHYVTSFTNEGADEYIGGGELGEEAYAEAESDPVPVIKKSKSHYNKGSLKAATLKAEDPYQESRPSSYLSSSAAAAAGISGLPEIDVDDSPYELVPSDVYFKNNRNPDLGEIAGVVKPAGVSDEVVKAHLPPGVAGVPTFTYPSQYRKNPPGSLNKLQKFLTTADGKPMESTQSYKKRVEAYKKKEASFMLPQQFYDAQYSSSLQSQPSRTNEYESESQSAAAAASSSLSTQALNAIQRQQLQSLSSQSSNGIIQQQTRVKINGDSSPGSSGLELPSNIDPEIAAMIRAELDKDEVPEEIRSGFQQEGKRQRGQEKHRLNQQVLRQQASRPSPFQSQYPPTNNRRSDQNSQFVLQSQSPYANRQTQPQRPSPTFPLFHFNQNQRAHGGSSFGGFLNRNVPHRPQGSHSQQVVQKFFAPIPISPTIMSQTLKGRYQSPVPRYVVELAKKLQRDKDVQGIVRVSTKRGHGPPIEYLYPVRG